MVPGGGLVEARLLRILQEYVEAPRQGASGYPFEVPYLEVWERACRARERTHAVRMWNVRRKVSLGSLEEADDLLRRIKETRSYGSGDFGFGWFGDGWSGWRRLWRWGGTRRVGRVGE